MTCLAVSHSHKTDHSYSRWMGERLLERRWNETLYFDERRRYERVPFFSDVILRPADSTRPLSARTVDLSLGGVGLVTTATLMLGDYVTVTFPFPDAAARRTTEILGRVASFRADEDANLVGVEFLEPLSVARAPELVRRMQQV